MPKRILIIDDDPTVVKLIKSRLEANNYEVITAYDGEEGLKIVNEKSPDLIILDVLLPKIDGYTFIKELKKSEALRAIPVIVITIKEQLQDLFKQEGIYDYLVKPIQIKDLLNKIRDYIGISEIDAEMSSEGDVNP